MAIVDKPIWTGCFWGSPTEVTDRAAPEANPIVPPDVVVQTVAQNTILSVEIPRTGITTFVWFAAAADVPAHHDNAAGIIITDGKGASISLVSGVVAINELALVIK